MRPSFPLAPTNTVGFLSPFFFNTEFSTSQPPSNPKAPNDLQRRISEFVTFHDFLKQEYARVLQSNLLAIAIQAAILTASGYANLTAQNGTLNGIASLRQVFNATWTNSEQGWLVEDYLLVRQPSVPKLAQLPALAEHGLHPVEERGQQVFEVICSFDSLLDKRIEMGGDLPV
jgi:hypothetical protein